MPLDPQAEELLKKLADSGTQSRRRLHLCIRLVKGALAVRGGSTFSELRWYPPVEAAKGSLSWVFRAKQPESVRTGP